jgi:hypothetical protein
VCSRRSPGPNRLLLGVVVRPRVKYLIGGTAILLLILGPIVFVRNRKAARAPSAPSSTWLTVYRRRWPVIALLGVAACVFTYTTIGDGGQRWRVYGLPFSAAAIDSHGADYVGLVTLPLTLFNIVVWTTLPDVYASSGRDVKCASRHERATLCCAHVAL